MSELKHEIKCFSCSNWVVVEGDKCPKCGVVFQHKTDDVEREIRSNIDLSPKLIPIYETDHFILVGIKKVLRFVQIIFYAILSSIIWFISMAAG